MDVKYGCLNELLAVSPAEALLLLLLLPYEKGDCAGFLRIEDLELHLGLIELQDYEVNGFGKLGNDRKKSTNEF